MAHGDPLVTEPASPNPTAEQESPARRRWRGLLADAALLLVVVALGVKAAYGTVGMRDIDTADEGMYLLHAHAVPESGLPAVEWSPLYVLWDRAIIRAGVPLKNVPDASWAGLAVLLPASVFLLARALGASRVAALVAGGILPATTLIDVWPYPVHFATVLLLLAGAAAGLVRMGWKAAGWTTWGLGVLLVTYARAEFFYALLLYLPVAAVASGLAAWRAAKGPASARLESRIRVLEVQRTVLLASFGFGIGAGQLVLTFGSPKGDGTRPIIAFDQHYALNRQAAGFNDKKNPWEFWEEYIHTDFGEVKSVGAALRANPAAFGWHVRQNARGLRRNALEVAGPRVDMMLIQHTHRDAPPGPRYLRIEWITRASLLMLLGTGLCGAVIGAYAWVNGRVGGGAAAGLAMLALAAAPGIASALVVFPRFHYMIPAVAFAAAAAAAGVKHLPIRRPAWARRPVATIAAAVALTAALAAVVPNRSNGWCIQMLLERVETARIFPTPTPVRASVDTIHKLGIQPPVVVLDYSPVISFHSGFGIKVVNPFLTPAGEGFAQLVRRTGVGVVVIDPLVICPKLRDDPDFQPLTQGRDTPLFRVFPVAGHPGRVVAVRRDLVPPGN